MSVIRDLEREAKLAKGLMHYLASRAKEENEGTAVIDQETIDITVASETLFFETAQRVALRLITIDALTEAIDDVVRYHRLRKERLNAQRDTLRSMIAGCMIELGQKTLETPSATLSAWLAKEKLRVDNEAALPEEYIDYQMEVTKIPLTEKIEADLQAGKVVPGAKIEQPIGFSLRVNKS